MLLGTHILVNGYHYFDHEIVTTTPKPKLGWHLNELFLYTCHMVYRIICAHIPNPMFHISEMLLNSVARNLYIHVFNLQVTSIVTSTGMLMFWLIYA